MRKPRPPLRLAGVLVPLAFWAGAGAVVPGAGLVGAGFESIAGAQEVQQEVDVPSVLAGLGGKVRLGEWAPFEVTIKDNGDTIRTVLVALEVKDADGDSGLFRRAITTKPHTPLKVWLYARVPFGGGSGDVYTVNCYLARETGAPGDNPDRVAYEPGRQLGTKQFLLGTPFSARTGMLGIVGAQTAGLEAYAQAGPGEDFSPGGHELTRYIPIEPADVPDRWQGLMALETLVWTGAKADQQPGKLSEQQAQAIREWVERGGHFIVVLPVVGQTWLGGSSNPLSDIMPLVDVTRREAVDLEPCRYMLTTWSAEDIAMPSKAIVHTFSPAADAGPWDAIPILCEPAPDGRVDPLKAVVPPDRSSALVVRRLHGLGAVTVVGLDVPVLAGNSKYFEPGIFWNRVLGKRHELWNLTRLAQLQNEGKAFRRSRGETILDEMIEGNIEKTGQAAGGLLMALVVFGAFWLLAGPVGFFVLKQRKLVHHAWATFVLVVGAFTAIAWSGATALRQTRADGKHLTFLDHVYGQPVQRARAWVNLFLPAYGEQTVTVGDPAKDLPRWHHVLSSWNTPDSGGHAWASFPDARGYAVDARSPASITFPSRSTVKKIQADWSGPARWKMPLPLQPAPAPDGGPAGEIKLGQEIRFVAREPARPGDRDWRLAGSVVHNLPAPLEDVVIVLIKQQEALGMVRPSMMPFQAYAYKPVFPDPSGKTNRSWQPGTELNLGELIEKEGSHETIVKYLSDLTPHSRGSIYNPTAMQKNAPPLEQALTALALYSMLDPPNLRNNGETQDVCYRESSHTYDLGRWFTQPCIIIVGLLKNVECPVPISVDGRPLPTSGTTVVRWVYPLPPDPPAFRPPPTGNQSPSEGPGTGGGG